MSFVKVCSEENDQPIELPVEQDNTLLLSTVSNLFPGATGLKYRPTDSDAGVYRGLRLTDGHFSAPPDGSWSNYIFYCVFPKEMKRKINAEPSSLSISSSSHSKTKKLDPGQKRCTDMVVLGMAWRTTEDNMREYFSRFGDLAMVQLKRDPNTHQSKGYGFIRFTEYSSQVSCLSERHCIDGRWCEVKIPNSKIEGDRQEVSRKIYVGGLSETMTVDTLKDFFEHFGAVSDVFIPRPFRYFAFVTFTDPDVAQELLGRELTLGSHTLHIGSAAPKPAPGTRHNGPFGGSGMGGDFMRQDNGANAFAMALQQQMGSGPAYRQPPSQNGMDPGTALAALAMLSNPAVVNLLMGLTGQPSSGSQTPPTGQQTPQNFMNTAGSPYSMESPTGGMRHSSSSGGRYRGSGRYN